MKVNINFDLSSFIAFPRQGEQGYEIVISPRLGYDCIDKIEADILADALNKMFQED